MFLGSVPRQEDTRTWQKSNIRAHKEESIYSVHMRSPNILNINIVHTLHPLVMFLFPYTRAMSVLSFHSAFSVLVFVIIYFRQSVACDQPVVHESYLFVTIEVHVFLSPLYIYK